MKSCRLKYSKKSCTTICLLQGACCVWSCDWGRTVCGGDWKPEGGHQPQTVCWRQDIQLGGTGAGERYVCGGMEHSISISIQSLLAEWQGVVVKRICKKKKGLTTCLLFMCFIWSRHLGGHHFKHSTHLWLERLDYILVMNVDTVRNSKSHELFLHTSTNNASTNLCAQILTYIKFTHEFFYHYRGRCTCMICFL